MENRLFLVAVVAIARGSAGLKRQLSSTVAGRLLKMSSLSLLIITFLEFYAYINHHDNIHII